MSVGTVQLFYATLSLVAIAVVGVVVLLRLFAYVSSPAQAGYRMVAAIVAPNAVALAWIVAMLATFGSLYFSEVAHYDPCMLCWFQRIAMYPLAIILGIAAFRQDGGIRIYGQVVAAVGAIIATYHLALEWVPALDTGACGTGPACTIVWFRTFGFVSLPFLALSAFLLILTLLLLDHPETGPGDRADASEPANARSHE